jgi:heptosyltransferase-2
MELRDVTHIAIIQTAFIGDVALSLYLAQEIHELHPKAKITFVTTSQSTELARCANAIDEVIIFDKRRADSGLKGVSRIVNVLRNANVDCVFGLQRSARTAIIAALTRAKNSLGFSNATFSWLYKRTAPWELNKHEIERNRSLLEYFDDISIPENVPNVELSLPECDERYKNCIALAPGSVWKTKRWIEEHWSETAEELIAKGYRVVLIGGKDDAELCNHIAKSSGAESLAGTTSLPQTLSLLRTARVLITNDSAPTHLAGLVRCRTVTIYGSTVPEFGFAPRGSKDIAVENKSLKCRPCGIHGKRECPLGTMGCMTSITPSDVIAYV